MDKSFKKIGGKAEGLKLINNCGCLTPKWISLDTSHFESFIIRLPQDVLEKLNTSNLLEQDIFKYSKLIQKELRKVEIPIETKEYLKKYLKDLMGKNGVAVRSSMISEDNIKFSYAGIFKSILFVKSFKKCLKAIKDVWISSFSEHAIKYSLLNNIKIKDIKMGIIIQKMINPLYSGVLFTKDPLTGEDRKIINFTKGTSNKLVSGEVSGETIIIEDGKIPNSKIMNEKAIIDLLNYSKLLGEKPLDIEWAFYDEKVYLLQVRAITSIKQNLTLWDNSNIIESYYGKTTPLTFSVAQTAYYYVYNQFCKVVGVPKRIIAHNQDMFLNMIGYVDNKVYYNLSNWYRLLNLLPFRNKAGSYMENMMGVKSKYSLDEKRGNWSRLEIIYQYNKILFNWLTISIQVRMFHNKFNKLYMRYSKTNLEELSPKEIFSVYEDVLKNVISTWKAPIINDFLCMTFYGLLRSQTKELFGINSNEVYQRLLVSTEITSTKPVEFLKIMSKLYISKDFDKKLSNKKQVELLISKSKGDNLGDLFKRFLELYGNRCAHEQKMECPTYHDKPEEVIELIKLYSKLNDLHKTNSKENQLDINNLEIRGIKKKFLLKWISNKARTYMMNRENMRICRTQIFGFLRLLFRSLGKQLTKNEVLLKSEDINFLDINEIKQAVYYNKKYFKEIKERKKLYSKDISTPDRFFMTSQGEIIVSPYLEDKGDFDLCGLGCSPGEVSGEVLILNNLEINKDFSNKIIVTQRTEPSWAVLLPLCKGILVERGSVLSHSAIIAREIGIPAIVGIKNLTSKLKNGDKIIINGSKGTIKKVN